MRRTLLAVVSIVLVAGVMPLWGAGISKTYPNVALSGGFQSGNFADIWDLTLGDVVLTFTYDANGLKDTADAHAWSEFGIRAYDSDSNNFSPAEGVWLATDYDWNVNTFAPDPVGAPNLDMDDKLILQRQSGQGEGAYNLPSNPPNAWDNYGFWFDRDGVDQWQANMWGMSGTYNTAGMYHVVITLHATSATSATAYMTVNGCQQGFYTSWVNGPPQIYPAGMTFTGDMQHMQVFYGLYGYGATHSVAFNSIVVSGTLNDTTAPHVSGLTADPSMLWPPNDKMRDVTLSYAVSDDWDANPNVTVVVTCNEASFNAAADVMIVDNTHLKLRATRDGKSKEGRIYTITVTATDVRGDRGTATTTVTVPHDMSGKKGLIATAAAVPTAAGAQIVISLTASANVTARILNLAGRPVRTLCSARAFEAGTSTVLWNTASDRGLRVPRGTYLIEISTAAADGARTSALTQVRVDR